MQQSSDFEHTLISQTLTNVFPFKPPSTIKTLLLCVCFLIAFIK